MRAVSVDQWMDPADLKVTEVPEPEVRPGTVAIDVKAAGCNFFDLLIVQGKYQVKPPFPFIPGAEMRLALTYEDPKAADNTPEEAQRYDERVRQIGREIFYAMRLLG
jgi:hypothetical protein